MVQDNLTNWILTKTKDKPNFNHIIIMKRIKIIDINICRIKLIKDLINKL